MASNNNLDLLRELSHSQLEALLRFDSPPETPIPPADLDVSKNDGEPNSYSYIRENREQFGSQLGSQIDYSIFQHCSPNVHWSLSPLNFEINQNDNSIILNSLQNAVEIPDESMQKCLTNLGDEIFIDNRATNISDGAVSTKETSCTPKNEYDDEVDNIFRKIGYSQPKFLTQFEPNTYFKDSHTKIVHSCPPRTKSHFFVSNSPLHFKAMRATNPSSCLRTEKTFTEFNSISVSNLHRKTDNNERNKDTEINPSFNNEEIEVTILENTQSQHSFGFSNSIQKQQCNVQAEKNTWQFFDEDLKDKTLPSTTSNNLVTTHPSVDASSIPFSVQQLYDIVKTNYSDFAFIYALSCQLCQDRVPMECFVTLKMALLLSLVSIGNNENRSPIPIVAITNDTYMTDYLMQNIGQLGSRFLGPMDDTKSFSSTNWMDADSVLLARGGVYYTGDWNRLKLKKAENIFKNVECSSIFLENSTLSFPLETAIWTHWRSFKYGAKDQQTFNKFLKIFGIPIFVSDDNHDALVDYTLEQSSIRAFESTVDHLSINDEDMRTFLICMSQNNVDLSPEAELLLKNYFVASRSLRPDCLSKQSYIMLKQFAESFAKLSMRKVVLSDDALAAILMCEHFLENIFSSSENSPPHFGNFNFVGAVDSYLKQFKEWLGAYIKKFKNE